MNSDFEKSEQVDMNRASEAETIRMACAGDPQAFERLYQMHNRRVYGVCLRMARNPTEAEDLAQDAFLQAFRKIHTFRGESSFSTWLYKLTFNTVLMKRRKKRCVEVSADEQIESAAKNSKSLAEFGAPDLRLSGVLDHVNLAKAIAQLPNGYREIFILHDIQGYEHGEIAKIRGCSAGNSKSQLFKARFQLRNLLQEASRTRGREKRELLRKSTIHISHAKSATV